MKAELDNDFDFGFSIVDENELDIAQTAKSSSDKVDKIYKMILPLLSNLEKNPDKDYIYWPNRIDKIKEFKQKIKAIYES